MLPNRESGPQNQPKAKVTVSILVGREASIGGIVTLGIILISCLEILVWLQPINETGKRNATIIKGNIILAVIIYLKRYSRSFMVHLTEIKTIYLFFYA